MTDPSILAELGIRRIPVPVPFSEAGGPMNVYVIEEQGGGFALFDAGLGTEECERWLRRSFAQAGLGLADIRRVLISHGHVDHYGAAELIRSESGAPVYLHPADRDKTRIVSDPDRVRGQYRDYLLRLGLAEQALKLLAQGFEKQAQLARPIAETLPLAEGDVFHFKRFSARVLHVPGHSPGQVMLHDDAHRLLLSADHVLEKIIPNPAIELGPNGEEDKDASLVSYLRSARRTHALDVDWVLPGHNWPFQGHRPVLEGLFTFYERRKQRLLTRLEAGPAGALELVFDLYPATPPQRIYLVLSDVVGGLELLEDEGRIVRSERDGRYIWSLAAHPAVRAAG